MRVEQPTQLVLELDVGRAGRELAAPRLRGCGGSRRTTRGAAASDRRRRRRGPRRSSSGQPRGGVSDRAWRPQSSPARALPSSGVSSQTVRVAESKVNVATRNRAAPETSALLRRAPVARRSLMILKVPVAVAAGRWQSERRRGERARLTRVQDGWLVRVPASSANVGPAFDAVAVALGTHLEVFPDGDDPAPETHPAVRAFRNAGGRGPLCVRSRFPGGRGLGILRRGAGRRPARGARPTRSHRPRGARRDLARRDRARGPRRQRGRGALRRRRGGRRPPCRAHPARARARGAWCGSPSARPRPRAPAACFPSRSRSTTRCSTSAGPRLLVAALAAGAVDAMRVATEDRLHQNRRLAARPRHARRDRGDARRGRVRGVAVGVGTVGRRVRRPRRRAAASRPRCRRPDARSCSTSTTKGQYDHMKLEGKCVVVTGAAGGIGAALATPVRGRRDAARSWSPTANRPASKPSPARIASASASRGVGGAVRRDQGVGAAGAGRHDRGARSGRSTCSARTRA